MDFSTNPEREPIAAESADALFDALLDGAEESAYMLDGDGNVLVPREADDRVRELGRAVAGVRRDAERAVRYLDLGAWFAVVVECDHGALGVAPLAGDAERLVIAGAPATAGSGYARRLLGRAATRAASLLMLER